MNTSANPARITIFFGLTSGLLAGAATWFSGVSFLRPLPLLPFLLWGMSAGYALLLARWSRKSRPHLFFPLALLLLPCFIRPVEFGAVFPVAVWLTLAWLRSGLDWPGSVSRKVAAEVLIGICTVAAAFFFTPRTPFDHGLAVWLFFLIQSLYFFLLPGRGIGTEERAVDRFEEARRLAEQLLS